MGDKDFQPIRLGKTRHLWVGMKPADRRVFFGSLALAGMMMCGVVLLDEREKVRRHKSIAKDIARERWRREQLGIPAEVQPDDGFADQYMVAQKNAADVAEAERGILELEKRFRSRGEK